MRASLLSFLLFCALPLSAQTYFYIEAIQVEPAQPTSADDISIHLLGGLSSTGAYIVGSSASVTGNVVTITITAADPGGATVIVPHTETVPVGQLDAGTYTVDFNATNVGDFAPGTQHTFVVSGGAPVCDSLVILSVQWHAFSDTAVMVHVYNNSSDIFAYPNFILLDANGDTLAKETVNFFGIVEDSWHLLTAQPGVTLPVGPFAGTLELWTLFTEELACTFNGTWDLCPPGSCHLLVPTIQNMGGGIAIGNYLWNVSDPQLNVVATGTLEMTADQQSDTASACLPPGAYSITVAPLDGPTGGQPVFTVGSDGWNGGPSQTVNWSQPVPLFFDLYLPCAEIAEGLAEQRPTTILTQLIGTTIRVWRSDGAPLGPVNLFDAQGRSVARATTASNEVLLPIGDLPTGLLILHTLSGRVKVVAGF